MQHSFIFPLCLVWVIYNLSTVTTDSDCIEAQLIILIAEWRENYFEGPL